jgi:hypothetical protein
VEKSDVFGASSQRKEYLGFLIDTVTMTVEVPEAKLDRISHLLKRLLHSNSHKVRKAASMLGKLNALELALGKAVFVGTRLTTIMIVIDTEMSDTGKRRRNPWEARLVLDDNPISALHEVGWQLGVWNGHQIRAWHTGILLSSILPLEATALLDRKIPARRVHDRRVEMASNASDFGVASYSIEGIPESSFSDNLEESEKTESSSVRELLAIKRAFITFHVQVLFSQKNGLHYGGLSITQMWRRCWQRDWENCKSPAWFSRFCARDRD